MGTLAATQLTTAPDLTSMFEGAAEFDQDITTWTVATVTKYENMFKGAAKFNQNLNNWAVGDLDITYTSMFDGASKFQHNLCGWSADNATPNTVTGKMVDMFKDTMCPPANFNGEAGNSLITGKYCCTCTNQPAGNDAQLAEIAAYPGCG